MDPRDDEALSFVTKYRDMTAIILNKEGKERKALYHLDSHIDSSG